MRIFQLQLVVYTSSYREAPRLPTYRPYYTLDVVLGLGLHSSSLDKLQLPLSKALTITWPKSCILASSFFSHCELGTRLLWPVVTKPNAPAYGKHLSTAHLVFPGLQNRQIWANLKLSSGFPKLILPQLIPSALSSTNTQEKDDQRLYKNPKSFHMNTASQSDSVHTLLTWAICVSKRTEREIFKL